MATVRNPRRIHHTIRLLEEAWQRNPDWRLAQLIENAAKISDSDPDIDLFDLEDDRLAEGLFYYAFPKVKVEDE